MELTGCDTATFPAQYGPSQSLTVGSPRGVQTCENPLDVGQAIPNVLALPLRWSVEGNELTLTPTTSSDYLLVLTATPTSEELSNATGCASSTDPRGVLVAFVSAAKDHDDTTLATCTYPGAPLPFDPIPGVATGVWLPDEARVENKFKPSVRLSSAAVVFDVPSPPQSRGTIVQDGSIVEAEPPYQGGMFVALDRKSDGLFYVVEVDFYSSD